jgi:hypothetical protein
MDATAAHSASLFPQPSRNSEFIVTIVTSSRTSDLVTMVTIISSANDDQKNSTAFPQMR